MPDRTLFQTYLLTHKPYAESTLIAYQNDVGRLLAHLESASTPVDTLTPEALEAYLDALRPAARNRALRGLTLYFDYCFEAGHGPATHPAANLRRQPTQHRRYPDLRYRDLQTLEATALGQMVTGEITSRHLGNREAGILALFAHFGLTTQQATALTTDDLVYQRGKLQLRLRTPDGDTHHFDVPNPRAQILGPLSMPSTGLQTSPHHTDGPLPLLIGLRGRHLGQPLSAQGIRAALKRLARAAGIRRPVTPTSLRRLAQHPDRADAATARALKQIRKR